ncbi:MAG: hypothetical protein ACE5GX_03680 [Thermoanaerobaculia bacterium]
MRVPRPDPPADPAGGSGVGSGAPSGLSRRLRFSGGGCRKAVDLSEAAHGVFPEGVQAYDVQMHVHGHSHHNGDLKPGSMQWHSYFADLHGFDVLWWSDHSEMFDLHTPLKIDYQTTELETDPTEPESRQAGHRADRGAGFSIGLASAPEEDVAWIERQARKLPGRTNLVVRSPRDRSYTQVSYSLLGPSGTPRGFLLPRPVSSGAVLALDIRAWGTSADACIEVEVGLSWHRRNAARRHQIRYQLSGSTEASRRVVAGASTVLVKVPISPERERIVLDLQRDASLLLDGEDNTITSIDFRMSARRGARASLELFGLELASLAPDPEHQLAQIRRFASKYEDEYGHEQHVGVEFLSEDNGAVRLNAFLPSGALTSSLAAGDEETWRSPGEFVGRTQAAGGVVSLNHMFGTTVAAAGPAWQATLSERKVRELLSKRAYGVDLLEVGYLERGGVGLDYHLRTWDALTARGLYLYGNGVTDTHGSEWGPEMKPNPFSTTIFSMGSEPEQLIAAIRKGRMTFGDPFGYRGRLYFRVGDAQMGDRVRVRREPQELRIGVDQAFDPRLHRLFLVQGRIRPDNPELLYLTSGSEGGHRQPLSADDETLVDVSRPSFVRLELYDRDDTPLLFTNPIVFERRKPEPK